MVAIEVMPQQFPHSYSQDERILYGRYFFKKYSWPIVIVVLVLIFLISSLYTVDPDEVGIILRFGKYHTKYTPGLHVKLPFGIDKVYKIKVTQIRTEEFGFRSKEYGAQGGPKSDFVNEFKNEFKDDGYTDEALMLSGDLNMAEVAWIVQYRVEIPEDYLFKVRDKQKNLRDIAETAMREMVGDRSIDEILTIGRESIEENVREKLQKVLNNYQMGIKITLVKLKNVNPPKAVTKSFNEVNEARQEKERMINEAMTEYNKTIPLVEGEAEQLISQAQGYKTEKEKNALGEVGKFNMLLAEYNKAKEITKKRLYLETMSEIYKKAGNKIVIDEELKSILPMLDLEKLQK